MIKIRKKLTLILIVAISTIASFYGYGLITYREAASIGIIGSADGPTAIFVASNFHFGRVLLFVGIFILLLSLAFLIERVKKTTK